MAEPCQHEWERVGRPEHKQDLKSIGSRYHSGVKYWGWTWTETRYRCKRCGEEKVEESDKQYEEGEE